MAEVTIVTTTTIEKAGIRCSEILTHHGPLYPLGGYVEIAKLDIGKVSIRLSHEELVELASEIDKMLNPSKRHEK